MQRPELSVDPAEATGVRIVLVGFMGAGKTSVARTWAQRGAAGIWFDSDRAALARLDMPDVASAWSAVGEAGWRAAERAAILERAAPLSQGVEVWSLGGGAVLDADVQRALLDGAHVVWLDADVELLWRRAQATDRPLALDAADFARRYDERRATYDSLADVRLDSGTGSTVDDLASRLSALAGARALESAALAVAPGLVDRLGELATICARPAQPPRVALVADARVSDLADRARAAVTAAGAEVVDDLRLPMGEWHKQLGTAEGMLRNWVDAGLPRDGLVVAIGGGTLLDAAGFAASIHKRGTPWVSVPTTLVAQVDAGIGGKTGVNLGPVKNAVGTVHQPDATVIDPHALATLAPDQVRAGLVEAVKTALLAGDWLLERVDAVERLDHADAEVEPAWAALVAGCAAYKDAVVAEDPEDVTGVRAQLNLGHTLGHAIEAATGGAVSHGAAVAVGIHAALHLSIAHVDARAGEALERYLAICTRAGIDVRSPLAFGELVPWLRHDKKLLGGAIGWSLLAAPGEPATEVPLALDDVRRVWEEHIHDATAAGGARTAGGRRRVLVLFGVNLGELGRRDATHYGAQTLPELVADIERWADELGLVADCRQTDSLERFVGALHEARTAHDAVLVNPGAWTHHERAVHDALEPLPIPRVEIHISDVASREQWRQTSVVTPAVDHVVSGHGVEGYREALEWVANRPVR